MKTKTKRNKQPLACRCLLPIIIMTNLTLYGVLVWWTALSLQTRTTSEAELIEISEAIQTNSTSSLNVVLEIPLLLVCASNMPICDQSKATMHIMRTLIVGHSSIGAALDVKTDYICFPLLAQAGISK